VYRGGYAYSDTIPNTLYVSKYGDRRFKEDGHAYSATAMYNIYGEPTFVWEESAVGTFLSARLLGCHLVHFLTGRAFFEHGVCFVG